MRARSQRKAMFAATRDLPAVTRDGIAISLNINAGLLIDVPHLHDSGADGIGLYRTEIPFMVRSEFPDVAAQTDIYRKILTLAGDKPVVFRTLDVGGDKVLPYWRGEAEENPAMGWRAIRIGLDRPIMLRQQLRALLRAAAERPLHVMFPMISEVAEFVAARRVLELELKRLRTAGKPVPSEVTRRRHVRGAGPGLAAEGAVEPGRFPLGRQQRSPPVPVRQRPRQPAHRRPLRHAVAGHAGHPRTAGRANAARPAFPSACAARWRASRSMPWP